MMETLARIADWLSILTLVSAIPVFVVGTVQEVRRRSAFPDRRPDGSPVIARFPLGAKVFASLVLATFLLSGFVALHARNVVRDSLAPGMNPRVFVKGTEPADQESVLAALRSIDLGLGHHSHPLGRFKVEISSGAGRVLLELARDSDRPDEYWVYMPGYWVQDNLDIGQLTSPVFAED
jgi:hypothetical protein